MKYFKRVSIVVGSVITVVLLAVFGLQFYLNTEPLRQRILAKVNQAVPGTLTWRQHKISLLGGKVELNHVRLTGPEDDKLIELERFLIHVSWTGLLKGELTVYDLLLENPNVSLVKNRSGELNLTQAFLSPKDDPSKSQQNSGLSFNVVVRRLQVANGFFQYQTSEEFADNQKNHVVLQNVNLLVTDADVFKRKGRIGCQIAGGKILSRGVRTVIDRVSLAANIQKDRIDAIALGANAGDLHVSLSGTVENPFTETPILNLDLTSRVLLSRVKALMMLSSDISGEVRLNSTLKGTLDNPDVDLTLKYKGGALFGKRVDKIHLNFRLKEKMLNIDDISIYSPLGTYDIKGDVDLRKAFTEGVLTSNPDLNEIFYKFSVHQKNSQLAALVPGISGLKGVANAKIEVEGQGFHPNTLWAKAALELYINRLSAGQGHSSLDVLVRARADMDKGGIKIQNLSANTGLGRLEMNGSYDRFSRQVDARFKLKASDLNGAMTSLGIQGVSGGMKMSGEISGTAKTPFMDARLQGENLGFENVRFGKADANIQFSKGQFFLKNGKIINGNSTLDISGSARIKDPENDQFLPSPGFDVSLTGDPLFLEDFVQGMTGEFVLNGRVNGSWDHPKGQLDLRGKNMDLNLQNFNEINLTSTIDGRRIHIDPLSLLIVPGEKIVLNGWVSMDKNYEFSMSSNDISLKNITKAASVKIDSGKISFDISGKGGLEDPRIEGKAVLSDFSFNNRRLEKIPFEIKVKDQTARLSGGQSFILDATYGLQTRSFSTSVRFDNTNLTPFLQLAGKTDLNGAITGRIESKGNFETPIRIEGRASIAQLEIFWKDTSLIKGNDLILLVRNDEISIPGMRLSVVDYGHFTIKGSGTLNKDLDLEADGNIPFKILPMLTDKFSSATGETRFSLKVNGRLSTPNLVVQADIKDGGMTIPGLFQKLHDINGGVRITSDAIAVDGIKGMMDTGKFELYGAIDLDRYQPSNMGLRLKVDNLPISIPDVLDIRLNSELNVRGSPEKSMIKGNVELIEGIYDKDVRLNLMESIGRESRQKPVGVSKLPWPIFNNMALDCKIGYRDTFVVDNNIALLTIKPDLHIHGTVNQPLISGRAEVESGTVYFQRNEFNVKKGVFDFVNPYKIEPTIDVQSEVKIRKWTVFLEISGTPDTLRVDMTSDPSEREEDILSLLISGKTTQELIAKEGGSYLSPTQMLANVLAENMQEEIKEATGLDILVLEYNEAKDAEASDEVKVTMGKELSRRATVKYDVQTKNAKVIRKVITEYKFLEKLLMNAFQDTEGNYGGGIQFRLEFR